MKEFKDKVAVVTGAGSGMGRELSVQLASEGCHLAICDVMTGNLSETQEKCEKSTPPGTRVTHHICDVSREEEVAAFCKAVQEKHGTEHIHLLLNNAGIAGGGSFIMDERSDWDRTFGVCWFGVYYCTRAFMPMLMAADAGHIVNISSINGFWADAPHTAYSSAKFAVKGFSEGLLIDLRQNAPHLNVSVVMPGHIGTPIGLNTRELLGKPDFEDMSESDVAMIRKRVESHGIPTVDITDDQLRALARFQMENFRDNAPLTAAQAATIILDGVRNNQWRILVGEDAVALDRLVRETPETAYEPSFVDRLVESGYFNALELPDFSSE